jgi:hypothetical protein
MRCAVDFTAMFCIHGCTKYYGVIISSLVGISKDHKTAILENNELLEVNV